MLLYKILPQEMRDDLYLIAITSWGLAESERTAGPHSNKAINALK